MDNYRYANEASREVILIVYEDEKGNKYLDEGELKVLLGRESMNEYVGSDGFTYVTSNSITSKGAPDDVSFKGTIEPDFSDTYPYNSNLGLYLLTESEIMELIWNFEKTYPSIKVVPKREEINEEKMNNEKIELKNKEVNEGNIYNKGYINNLNEMFDDLKNENDKNYYEDHTNTK